MNKGANGQPAYPYRIYAAPRVNGGYYGFSDTYVLLVDGFSSDEASEQFWSERIVPATRKRSGLRYEYVRCTFLSHRNWTFVSERRYSDQILISGTYERFGGDGPQADR